MDEQTTGILFIILVPLFFLGMIASIIFLIIKNIKSKKNIKSLAQKNNWKYYNKIINNNPETKEINGILHSTINKLFTNNKISVTDILKGNYKDYKFWFSNYKSSNKQGNSQTHISSEFNIFIIPNEDINQELIMIYRSNLLKHLPIEKISEIIGKPLFNLEEKEIDWLLVSDIKAFENLNISFGNIRILHDIISKAHSVLFYKGMYIYAVKQSITLNSKKVMGHLENISQLKLILGK
jgi:hypothetical protein